MTRAYDRTHVGLPASVVEELRDLSRRGMTVGAYEMGYHALASALHAAEAIDDRDQLVAIQAEALQHQDVIDRVAPGHRLSRLAGREAGRAGWFEVLSVQITAILTRLRASDALSSSTQSRRRS